MIRAIFFDSDDVIVKEGYSPGIAEYEKAHNLAPRSLYTSAHDRPYWQEFTLGRVSEKEYFDSVKKDYRAAEIDVSALKKSIDRNFQSNAELINFLKSIKERFAFGIISNHPKEWFESCVKIFNWNEVFSVYAVSGNIHYRKPDYQGRICFRIAPA